jgi:signal transduction histidine kinase
LQLDGETSGAKMNRTIVSQLARPLLVGICVAAVLTVVVRGGHAVLGSGRSFGVLLSFLSAALCVVGLGLVQRRVDRLVGRLTHHREVTPYSALASAVTRIRAGSLEQALPGLAEVLAGGTGASRAVVWLAVGDRLVRAAAQPPNGTTPPVVENLAVLLARPDTDHVVPVLDGTVIRAALAIGKPDAAITPEDQRLMQDVANGAGLLLRSVALNAELADRIRRADDLATELQASQQRLARAREIERRRLVNELRRATADRLASLRSAVFAARTALDQGRERAETAQAALERARIVLEDLIDRVRVIARGVYPAVLREQGPVAALDELAADLPRPVRLTGAVSRRLAWEIESGIYYLAAGASQQLAGRPAERELVVHLEHSDGRLSVHIEDPTPPVTTEQVRDALAVDAERLAALGGELELTDAAVAPDETASTAGSDVATPCGIPPARVITLRAWVPDRLEPQVERVAVEVGTR